jgi:hypothetical protein
LSSGYQKVIDKYTHAMTTLIDLHSKKFPNIVIELNNSSLPFVAYKKIVTPYAMYVKGWAGIAEHNFAQRSDYLNNLIKTQALLQQYRSKVEGIAALFPADNKDGLIKTFYEIIGSDTVDSMYHIIETLSNQAAINPDDLQSAFIAYEIAHEIYQKDMKILSVSQGSDFSTAVANKMKTLYANALMLLQNNLSIGNLGADKIEDIYAQIKTYNQYLSQVYADIKDTKKSALYADLSNKAAAYKQNYQAAEKKYIELQDSLKKIGKAVSLDVNNPKKIINDLNQMDVIFSTAISDAKNAQILYNKAQDSFGAGQMSSILAQLGINLLISNALDQLWLLFLNDQSSSYDNNGNPLYTAPSIAAFISQGNKSSADLVRTQEVGQAFQNLAALINQNSNSISALSSNKNLAAYPIDQLMQVIQTNFLQVAQAGEKVLKDNNYLVVSMVSVAQAIKILFYIQQLASSLANLMQKTDAQEISIAVAYVCQYAKQLDTMYASLTSTELPEINALIPYLPKQVNSVGLTNSKKQSWLNWSEQVILASGLVTSADLVTVKQQAVEIKHPQVAQNIVSDTQLANMMTQAHQSALSKDFVTAAKAYNNLYQLYSNLYASNPSNSQYLQKMQLVKTFYTATSFASSIQEQGAVQSWQTIKNIPTQYKIAQYKFTNISISDFGMSELPTSLTSIPAGTAYSSLTKEQQDDAIKILKAYMVSQVISAQGYNFTDIFKDYTLTQNANVDSNDLKEVQEMVQQVEAASNNFVGCNISSIVISSGSTIQLMVCNNLVISRVKPLFSSMATALTFFASAELLIAPSAKAIQLGGVSYTPGNDKPLTDIMLDIMVHLYLSAGLVHWNEAINLMQTITATLPKGQSATQELPKDFQSSLAKLNKYIISAQAMLFAQDQSAYAYSLKLNNQELATNVRNVFFSTYQTFIDWMTTKCLIGSPYQDSYRNLINMINNTYVNWSTWLDPQKDAAQIKKNTADSIALIQKAGDACMNTSYIESLYPGYRQQHYAAAASYYQLAGHKYEKISDKANVAAMEAKAVDAYFKGINQAIDLFLNYVLVKGKGLTYVHEQTNQSERIDFDRLMQDNQGGISSLGEQKAYDSVKDLLLNAGKGLILLLKKAAPTKSAALSAKEQIISNTQSSLSNNVVSYLKSKNIMDSTHTEPLYFNVGVANKIYATNMDAYSKFKSNPVDYASWLNVLYSALEAIYAFNYLGAKQSETGGMMQQQIQAFFTALQASAVATENNADAYGE